MGLQMKTQTIKRQGLTDKLNKIATYIKES